MSVVRDRHRRLLRHVREQPLDEELAVSAVEDHAERLVTRDSVLGALRRLPARQREVVVLRFFADLGGRDGRRGRLLAGNRQVLRVTEC